VSLETFSLNFTFPYIQKRWIDGRADDSNTVCFAAGRGVIEARGSGGFTRWQRAVKCAEAAGGICRMAYLFASQAA